MADQITGRGVIPASEQEIEQLREEIRQLRGEQERLKDNSKPNDENQNKDGADKNRDTNNAEKQAKDDQQDKEDKAGPRKSHPLRTALIIGAVIVIAIAGVLWWLHARQFESTDDATVDGHISGIAARTSGTIQAVYFEENQFVAAGQTLVDLDPRDAQVSIREARSQLLQAQSQVQAEQPNIPVTQITGQVDVSTATAGIAAAKAGLAGAQQSYAAAQARIAEAQANNTKAQADVERFRPLAAKDEVPQQQFDQVVAAAKAQAADVAAAKASAAAASEQVDRARAEVEQAQQRFEEASKNSPRLVAVRQENVLTRQAAVQAAQAQLAQAALNLSYLKIATPVAGIVAKRTAEVGQRVSPGQQVALITQLDDLWVTANYKETQLEHMRSGQSVSIHVDALDTNFMGYLESLPAASGAVTSLLPPENATGNFVKVVQRLPVRIRFNKNQAGLERLRPGMSAEPETRVR